jgi:hypothetical protein
VERGVQGGDEGIAHGDGEERPPDHGLVYVDPPGEDGVGDEAGIPHSLQHHIVVVLST